MEPTRDPRVLERMELAFDLYEAAEEMMRQNLRRRSPEATEEEIERGIRDWLSRQPGSTAREEHDRASPDLQG